MDWRYYPQWSTEKILQLLELYKLEPCLWDPRTKNYKNRSAHIAAWNRILAGLPFKTTLEEAKKKKNSLMGYYRIHLNRYKKTLALTGGNSEYQTTWFAFNLMHSFLSPIYGPKKKKKMAPASTTTNCGVIVEVKSEPTSNLENENIEDEIFTEDLEITEDSLLKPSYPNGEVNEDGPSNKLAQFPNTIEELMESEEGAEVNVSEKKLNEPDVLNLTHVHNTKRNITEFNCARKRIVNRDNRYSMDEYDHFGAMLASKIRKINSSPEREILMNSVQNLVFETYMKCRSRAGNCI